MKKDNKDYKKLYEEKMEHYNKLQNKLYIIQHRERLEDYILNDRLKKDVDLLHNKIDDLEDKIESLAKLGYNEVTNDPPNTYKSLALQISDLSNKIDDLEAKNYQLKADLDRIINNINLNDKGGE